MQRSNRRWRASSAKMIEVRGERTGTAVGDSDGGELQAHAAVIMSTYNAFSPAKFQDCSKPVFLSLMASWF